MSALSVPKVANLGFAEAIDDGSAMTQDLESLSLAVQQTWHLQQRVDFARVAKIGCDEAASQMRLWLSKLPTGTGDFLSASGAFNSTTAMVHLYSTYQLVEPHAEMGGKA